MTEKYRLMEIQHPLRSTTWVIQKKHWYGWRDYSSLFMCGDYTDKKEAEKMFDYLTGKTSVKTIQIK
jgi:hypothetical protein